MAAHIIVQSDSIIFDIKHIHLIYLSLASKFYSQDVIRLARYFETQLKHRVKFKVAVIVSRDLKYGLLRMYQVAAADLPAKIGIFINIEDAKKWVTGSDWA